MTSWELSVGVSSLTFSQERLPFLMLKIMEFYLKFCISSIEWLYLYRILKEEISNIGWVMDTFPNIFKSKDALSFRQFSNKFFG